MLTRGAFVSMVAQVMDPTAESVPFVSARGDVVWNKDESSAAVFAVLHIAGEVFDREKSLSENMRNVQTKLIAQAAASKLLAEQLQHLWSQPAA